MAFRHKLIGKAARLYWAMTRPRTLGVRGLVLNQRGEVALVRHTYGDHWYLPGGGVKKNEGFSDALSRELEEEIALHRFTVERILGVYHSRKEYKDDHVVVFVVRASDAADGPLARADLREIEEAGWFSMKALPPEVSPATARRIEEYQDAIVGTGTW